MTNWSNRDSAWHNITEGILKVVDDIRKQKSDFITKYFYKCQVYLKERNDLIFLEEDSALSRNIKRLAKKHPETANLINEYRDKLVNYKIEFDKEMEKLYENYYSYVNTNENVWSMNAIQDKFIMIHDSCLIKELVILIKLNSFNLKYSHFGFPKSYTEISQEHKKITDIIIKKQKGLLNIFKECSTPIRFSGFNKRNESDEFEEI